MSLVAIFASLKTPIERDYYSDDTCLNTEDTTKQRGTLRVRGA